MPRVSVLLPVRNEEPYLDACIQSLLEQSYQDFEIICVDDASTDKTSQILAGYNNPKLKIFTCQTSLVGPEYDFPGIYEYMLCRANGDLIAHIGGDDICQLDRLEEQVAAFDQDPDLMICHSAAAHIDAKSRLLPTNFTSPAYSQQNLLRMLFAWNFVAFPTTMIRREAFQPRAGTGMAHDYDLWLRTAGKDKYRYLPDRLIYYRTQNNCSSNPNGQKNSRQTTYQARRDRRAQLDILELFPEIPDTNQARTAAYLEMGNLWLAGNCPDLEMAMREYLEADKLMPDRWEIAHNACVVSDLMGYKQGALEALAKLPVTDLVNRTRLLAKGILHGRHKLATGHEICPNIYKSA